MLDTVVTLSGNVVAAPEIRYTATGAAVSTVRVATNSRFFDRGAGEWKDGNSVFVSVSCWRSLAENVAASLTKGDRVLVVGKLRQRSYDTEAGERRTVTDVEADAIGADLARATVTVQRMHRQAAIEVDSANGAETEDVEEAEPAVR